MIINDADTAHRVRKRSHVMLFPRDCLVMPMHSDHGMWWCLSSVLAHVILTCYVYYMHAHKSSKYKHNHSNILKLDQSAGNAIVDEVKDRPAIC